MNTKAITDRLQGFLDELIRADAVRDPEAILAAKAETTERLAVLLNDMPQKAKDAPKAAEANKHPRKF